MSVRGSAEQQVIDRMDVFGAALRDYHEGRPGPFEWERSDGVRTDQPIDFYFAAEGDFSPLETFGAERARGRVLDVGCGAGKHALAFQGRGHAVVGIDVSPAAVRVCTQRGVRDARVMDVFALDLAGSFDTMTFFSNDLSIGGTPDGVRHILRSLARIAAPGGRIVSLNRDASRGGDAAAQRYREANVAAGRPAGQMRMRGRYAGEAGPWFDWLFVSPAELEPLAHRSGWRVDEIANGETGDYCAVLRRDEARLT